ncbi:hypothetical protein BO79DRAFT_214079 [Aspergillus costaricaensis CBS 115574]|uniref:Uncharacterized protein n=1 Tax=Aspergillus costaricaensis CBS 115574 TaxID=1448317 RepID=A0ACD1IPZ2_9EURO|nr:hypothetical protein BO79DRAFT_214079 [Aspergillus costaricaensis CBS 115574]RAK92645.1 hypothetical protein BO79DRAFT_214079 [Aspergillus costaricaensis CBS 115574]
MEEWIWGEGGEREREVKGGEEEGKGEKKKKGRKTEDRQDRQTESSKIKRERERERGARVEWKWINQFQFGFWWRIISLVGGWMDEGNKKKKKKKKKSNNDNNDVNILIIIITNHLSRSSPPLHPSEKIRDRSPREGKERGLGDRPLGAKGRRLQTCWFRGKEPTILKRLTATIITTTITNQPTDQPKHRQLLTKVRSTKNITPASLDTLPTDASYLPT